MTMHTTVETRADAWLFAKHLCRTTTDWEFNRPMTENAGYPVFYCEDNEGFEMTMSDLSTRLEVNMTYHNITLNIWINDPDTNKNTGEYLPRHQWEMNDTL